MSRAVSTKKLSMGQEVTFTSHEEKQLHHAFDFLAGYSRRLKLKTSLAANLKQFTQLGRFVL